MSTDYLLERESPVFRHGECQKAPAPEEPEQEQDAIDAEFADRVSRLSESGREALSRYLDLLLKTEVDNSPRLKPGDSRLNDHCLQEQV